MLYTTNIFRSNPTKNYFLLLFLGLLLSFGNTNLLAEQGMDHKIGTEQPAPFSPKEIRGKILQKIFGQKLYKQYKSHSFGDTKATGKQSFRVFMTFMLMLLADMGILMLAYGIGYGGSEALAIFLFIGLLVLLGGIVSRILRGIFPEMTKRKRASMAFVMVLASIFVWSLIITALVGV